MKLSLSIGLCLALCATACLGADWLRFRGPNGSGVAGSDDLPTTWSEDQNIAWKAELPGRGISCPIVIGDHVVVTASSGFRQDRLHTICFDAASGKVRWERQLWATGRTQTHNSICPATPTPVSDGERVVVYFSSNDVACYDLDGNLVWLRGLMLEYPNASNSLGLASSPLVVGDTVVLPIETDSQSVALGLNALTGETRWAIDRPEKASWTSPILIQGEDGGEPLVILQSGPLLSAHHAHTGEQRWAYEHGCSTMPSSVLEEGVIYVPSNGLTALSATDSQAGPEVLWQSTRLRPSTATPLVYKGKVFTVSGSILKCGDAKTGKEMWQTRLTGKFTASPVAAGGRLYLFNEDGVGQVVEISERRSRPLVGGDLGERILCSPAVANGGLYVRSDNSLWKIAATD